jgi:hypothetical protein
MLSNHDVSHAVREIADLLQRSGESPFRVAAYRRAAHTIARHPADLGALLEAEGERGLRKLPGIGKSLAKTIARLLRKGRSSKLERLRERARGQGILETLPGVGKQLAQRVGQSLATDSLEEIYAAACDGRLRRVPGLGAKRLRAIRESLAFRLNAGEPLPYRNPADEPPIAELLALDAEYRLRAARGRLPLARPRLFNPHGQAMLPVWNVRREGLAYTVHFANSAASHRAGRIYDWVVITCTTKERFGQWTVITATHGQLRGRRLVMHHERQCREHYGQLRTQLALPLAPDDVLRPATGSRAN